MARGSFRTQGHGWGVAELGRTGRSRKPLDLLECLMGIESGQNCFLGNIFLSPVRCFALKKKLV